MLEKLQDVLLAVEKESRDRNLNALLKAMEPFVGSIHIVEWDRQTWGTFMNLALASAITRDDITDAIPGVRWDTIDSWLMALQVPEDRIRQRILEMVLASESRLAA